jgi:hypothetical protein
VLYQSQLLLLLQLQLPGLQQLATAAPLQHSSLAKKFAKYCCWC